VDKKVEELTIFDDNAFLGGYLHFDNTVSMSGIIWDNIGMSRASRIVRKIIIWSIAIAMVVVALILMVRFNIY
jgi:hypothetical protein